MRELEAAELFVVDSRVDVTKLADAVGRLFAASEHYVNSVNMLTATKRYSILTASLIHFNLYEKFPRFWDPPTPVALFTKAWH